MPDKFEYYHYQLLDNIWIYHEEKLCIDHF